MDLKQFLLAIRSLAVLAVLAGCSAAATSATPSMALPERFVSTDNRLTVSAPAGWTATIDSTQITLTSLAAPATFESVNDPMQGVTVVVGVLPTEMVPAAAEQRGIPVSAEPSAYEVLVVFGAVIGRRGYPTVGEISTFSLFDREAARAPLNWTTPDQVTVGEGVFMVQEIQPGWFISVVASTPPGDYAANEATIRAIAESVTYQPEE